MQNKGPLTVSDDQLPVGGKLENVKFVFPPIPISRSHSHSNFHSHETTLAISIPMGSMGIPNILSSLVYRWTDSSSSSWWPGVVVSASASINVVNHRRVRLLLRWVTVSGLNSRCVTCISVFDQRPRSTQPGHPFVGTRNEYQPKGGDALRLGSKGRYGSYVGGR